MEQVFLSGASGYLGRQTLKALTEKRARVQAVYRRRLPDPLPGTYPLSLELEEIQPHHLHGVKAIIHLAWEGGFSGPARTTDWNIDAPNQTKNIRAIKALLRAAEQASVQRIVFVSAYGASRRSSHPFLQEKYFAEFLTLNSKVPERVILRPGLLLGDSMADPLARTIQRLFQRFPLIAPVYKTGSSLKVLPLSKMIESLEASIHLDLTREKSVVFELAGESEKSLGALCQEIAVMGKLPRKLRIGGLFGKFLLKIVERESSIPHLEDFQVFACSSQGYVKRDFVWAPA